MLAVVLFALPSQVGGAQAQGEGSEPAPAPGREDQAPASLPGAVDPRIYRLGPGDRLRLVFSGPVSHDYSLVVAPEGVLLLPGAGAVDVDGLTLQAARDLVLSRLRRDVHGVEMDLRLERPRTFRLFLTGRAKHPGVVSVSGVSRLPDVLLPDGLEDDASRRNIEVLHGDGTRERADLGLFLSTGDLASLPWLRDGDVVQVPTATRFASVFGAVAEPGRYEIVAGDSLATLLRLAGGPLPGSSAERVLWLHWHEDAAPDSEWLAQDAISREARPLAQGDRLYVYFVPDYHLQREATILGEIARPGAYPITEGRTVLSDVVRAAGGFLPTADLSGIRIRRAGSAGDEKDVELERLLRLSRSELTASEYELLRTKLAGRREDYRVDWSRLQADRAALDLPLRDGDIIRVDRLVSSIRVDGEVRNPAILAYHPGLTVSEYVVQAGGFTSRAWVGKVRVTRAVTGQTLFARNIRVLDPGDFIWVPEKPDVTAWQQARDVLTALAQVATIVIAIRSVR